VKGAIDKARLGNLTKLVSKIEPAVDQVAAVMDREDPAFADAVAQANVVHTIETIRDKSEVLAEMESKGEVMIVGAMYDVATGEVRFL
jgi:carbonic anhydrase